MKYLFYCIISIAFFILINCSTPYQPKGILGGYSDKQLDGNLYKVAFWGNQHTKPEDVNRYLMYRCAELSQEKDYDYFEIIEEERDIHKHRYSVGGSRQSTGGYSGGSVRGPVQFKEYDFYYIIKLCDEEKSADHKTYYVPEILQELSVIIDK